MTTDLKTQIRDFAQEFGSGLPSVESEDVMGRRLTIEPSAPKRRRPGWAVALVAAAVVLVLVGGVAWLASLGGDTAPPITETPAPSTVPSTGPSTPTTTPLSLNSWESLPPGWSLLSDDAGVFQATANLRPVGSSVVEGGPGLVIVGGEFADSPDGLQIRPVAWTSVDGTEWSRVAEEDVGSIARYSGGRMLDVTTVGPRLVAVGYLDCPAVAWVSEDGSVWSRVPHEDSAFGADIDPSSAECRRMHMVAAGDGGMVALDLASHVWISPDARTWTPVPPADTGFSDLVGQISQVVAGGPGFVAVGQDCGGSDNPDQRCRPAVWTSSDGASWTKVAHDEAVFGPYAAAGEGQPESLIADVTVGGPGLVAVGKVGFQPAIWISSDGRDWTRLSLDERIFDQAEIRYVRSGAAGLVAVGQGGFTIAPVWTSTDGITWTRASENEGIPQSSRLIDIALVDQGIVAIAEGPSQETIVLVWKRAGT